MTLKEMRESKKLLQSELAEMIGISLRQYCRYETGEVIPKTETAQKLGDILGVSIIEIVAAVKLHRSN